jgi:hypothetical protein
MPQVGARSRTKSGAVTQRKKEPGVATARPRDAVTVRMYCHGLGDCFLVTIPRPDVRPFYMLIDCGIILGTESSKSLMTSVVNDVAATTKELDVVAVTHEHWDHVSAFAEAEDAFKDLTVHDVWVAWTENPSDPLARKLKLERKRVVDALRVAALRMNAAEPGSGRSLMEVLGFFGPSALGVTGGHSTEDAMQKAMALSSKPPRYCRPADNAFQLPELDGVRFYVLGPPQSEERLKRARPTKSGRETYDTSIALSPETCFLAAATQGAGDASEFQEKRLQELARPFDLRWATTVDEAGQLEFFQNHYFGTEQLPDQAWRGIDTTWLGSAGQLALQLDTYTNNTSLVLAIEFVKTRKVLLFAADVQVGNWQSWGDQTWSVEDDGQKHDITADDLLNRTVLYKVGHHGSHNATMRAEGLEKMKSDELLALVPVDHDMAMKKRWSGMPFVALMTRLHEKTSGRVLRIDDEQTPLEKPAPAGVPDATWARFQQNVRRSADKLYYEIRLPEIWG